MCACVETDIANRNLPDMQLHVTGLTSNKQEYIPLLNKIKRKSEGEEGRRGGRREAGSGRQREQCKGGGACR